MAVNPSFIHLIVFRVLELIKTILVVTASKTPITANV